MSDTIRYLDRGDGEQIAYLAREGAKPGLVWLGGFNSTMDGVKARALDQWAAREGRALLRFDYFAHGRSSGRWEEATVGRWRADALAVLDELTEGPQILIGSSLGGWIALLAALARPERVAGMILVAPAPDFTETLMWDSFPQHVREALEREGQWNAPSEHGGEVTITRTLIEEGRNWLLLDEEIGIDVPVHILQGWRDREVPWSHAVRVLESLRSDTVALELIKDGDHALTRPGDIERLTEAVAAMADEVRGAAPRSLHAG